MGELTYEQIENILFKFRISSGPSDFLMQTAMENRRKRSSRKRLSTVKSDDVDVRTSGAESVDSLSNTMFSVQRGQLTTTIFNHTQN